MSRFNIFCHLCLVLLLTTQASAQNNDLMHRATRIADASIWNQKLGYGWLSNRELVYFLDDVGVVAVHRDVIKNKDSPPIRLVSFPDPQWIDISPHARWIEYDLVGSGVFTFAARTDGSGQTQFGFGEQIHLHWMNDDHHWIEFYGKSPHRTLAIVHDLDHLKRTRRIWTAVSGLTDDWAIEFASDGRLLQASSAPIHIGTKAEVGLTVAEMRVRKGITLLHRYVFRAPPGMSGGAGMFPPQGDRVLWDLYTDVKTRGIVHHYECLWISKLNGRGMHEIGRLELSPSETPLFVRLRWMPDGRRLSFLYNNALWTLPVDAIDPKRDRYLTYQQGSQPRLARTVRR